jgi:hypothetical protein
MWPTILTALAGQVSAPWSFGVALPTVGCKADGAGVAPAASALAITAALADGPVDSTVATWHFAVDREGTTHVEMPGLKERIIGDTAAASGSLEVAPHDLQKSRGIVRVDLATFATHTFGNEKDATQTRHARTWLEVVVDGQTNEAVRWAEFAIRSIDAPSENDVTKVPAVKDGDDDLRRITMNVRGDLLVHGHMVQKEDVVEVLFRYPAGAAPDSKPKHIEVRSKEPMRIALKEHDVRPRDTEGKLVAWTAGLIAKVAEVADVSVDVGATPVAFEGSAAAPAR